MKTQSIPVTEITELQNNSNTNTNTDSNSPRLWQSVLVGGVPGLLIGAGGTVAISALAGPKPGPGGEQEGQETPVINVAHSVNDSMSFSEAFAAARHEVGPGGAFVWHGNVYGTYRADDPEWQAMSAEDRTEFSHNVLSQVHPAPYTPTANEPKIVEVPEGGAHEDVSPETDETETGVDVHIVDFQQGQLEDGTIVTVGAGTINGHLANFIDSDGDGEVDTVLLDANDNQALDEGEVHVASYMSVDDMIAEVQSNNPVEIEDALYGGTPDYTNDTTDYTNDADMGTYV